ncbi:MAG TPA: GNAT family N-acetyltransferase [Patescibacteria group bacterium]|nr:GNAT family N-acetyltransferase [Patescibacteria group bacterium]
MVEIKIEPITQKALPDYLLWFNDEEVRKYLYSTTPRTEAEISLWLDSLQNNSFYYCSIFHKGRNIGHVGLRDFDNDHHSVEISYVIGAKELWNKGIATEAVHQIIKTAKDKFKVTQITASGVTNPASWRVLEKCGFQRFENNFLLD